MLGVRNGCESFVSVSNHNTETDTRGSLWYDLDVVHSKLRKDAAHNRDLLLQAGRAVFAEHGLDATLNDVARYAGVGVATAYRRFGNKDELIDAIRAQQDEDLEEVLVAALRTEDAWAGLVLYLEHSLRLHAADRGMAQLLSGRRVEVEQHDRSRDRLAPLVDRVADRAIRQGTLRSDVTGTDLVLLQIACVGIMAVVANGPTGPVERDDSEVYLRVLHLALEGMRTAEDRNTPLPVPPLSVPELHLMMRGESDDRHHDLSS